MMKLLSAAMIVALTAGCAFVVGDAAIIQETPASVAQNVIIGKTSKAEVAAKYGFPSTVSFDSNGMEIWLYGSTAVDQAPTAHKALEVHFDKDGTATYYLLTEVDPQKRRQTQLAK
jgi:cell division protein FtsI/penicillin-binding protein 2